MKNITILGVTGSIGQQTVDVCLHHQDEFNVVAMSAGKNIVLLETTIQKINPQVVCVIDEKDCNYLQEKYPHIRFVFGSAGLDEIATIDQVDIVLNAIVGFAGLLPTIHAIESKKDIALANKETLVVAGHINKIKRILLTASGGSFRDKTREELVGVSVKEALNHPNWSMGAKITIDSATLFNKGLEVMEAKWLFDVDYDQIEVLIHPESILHSAVEFEDTSVIGQMGTPDMRLAIQYALTYPQRKKLVNGKSLDLTQLGSLTFKKPDFNRFHALSLAYRAGKTGGSLPCVLNGANEMANLLFREGKIEFLQIEELVEKAMNAHELVKDPTIDQLLDIDQWARDFVLKEINETCRRL